jgi:nucleotide-binding universal stress UspA family protein
MRLLNIKVVLAAVDRDDVSLNALIGARELASAYDATLHVVHATSKDSEGEPPLAQLLTNAGIETSDAALHVASGDPAYVIRSQADRVRADVIVLGRHRGSGAHGPLGSTAIRVVTSSWAPCLILARPMKLPLERVLAPIDLSDASRGTLLVALSWASALRGAGKGGKSAADEPVRLTALHVTRGTEQAAESRAVDELLDRLRADAGRWAGVAIGGRMTEGGDVAATIAEYAREHDAQLVVMGTRGLGSGSVGRLGSISLGVAQRLEMPVLLVPPATWGNDTRAA